jgi:hypothetical protein
MKLRTAHSNQGGVLVITIIICSLVGLMLAAYLSMVSSQHTFTQRSQVWNSVIPLCEAGVEEAMAHINHTSVTTNFDVNGWTLAGATRAAGVTNFKNLNGGTYKMHIENVWPPIITVWGSLKQPLANGDVRRAVQVRTRMNQRFPAAVLARGTVNLSGGAGKIDSFDSTNSAASTLGRYDAAKATANALVGTTLRTVGAIDVGNMDIWGSVATGPGGTPEVGSTGVVGDKAYVSISGNNGTVQSGHHINDANFYVPPASLPSDFSLSPTPLVAGMFPVGATIYKYKITTDGDYTAVSISIRNGEKMLIDAKARLHVRTFTEVRGPTSHIMITTNGSVEWYVEGALDLEGGAAINASGFAINLSFISLRNAPVNYRGTTEMYGTIYAPFSSVLMNGNTDCYGAITCDNFTLVGAMSIHYDEALRANPKVRFIAESWKEL